MNPPKAFLSDIPTLRRRAREHLEDGAVTTDYRGDRERLLALLNEALATEIVCWLRYRRHYFMAKGIHADAAAREFLGHSDQEAKHADQLAARIVQLRGEPNFSPEGMLARSHAEYVEGGTLPGMLEEDLVAERIAIESYREMIRYVGNDDSTTRTLLESILATEEEHANDLAGLLDGIRT